jgi:hypothetical protein
LFSGQLFGRQKKNSQAIIITEMLLLFGPAHLKHGCCVTRFRNPA